MVSTNLVFDKVKHGIPIWKGLQRITYLRLTKKERLCLAS